MKNATMKRIPHIPNKIESITIRRIVDESPDTSHLGEYSNKLNSDYSIDRAHSLECASVSAFAKAAQTTLDHAQRTIGDLQSEEKASSEEWDALEEAYNLLGGLVDEVVECDCDERGDMGRNEYRYFNPPYENYKGLPAEEIRKYCLQDYERMESAKRGNWCMIGIKAQAEISIPSTSVYHSSTLQTIHSGGLWGIESDSDKEYFAEVEKDELADLRSQLAALGFSERALAAAFKNVEHKDA